MAKRNKLAAVLQADRARRDELVRHQSRVFMLDLVTLALGRLGWGEKRFAQFDRMLTEVSDEYAKLIIEDSGDDEELVYAKACLGRELQRYVGKRFVPYDERYGIQTK